MSALHLELRTPRIRVRWYLVTRWLLPVHQNFGVWWSTSVYCEEYPRLWLGYDFRPNRPLGPGVPRRRVWFRLREYRHGSIYLKGRA